MPEETFFECNRCLDTFTAKRNLQQHMVKKFQCSNIFRCKECMKDFSDKSSLNKHYESEKHRRTVVQNVINQDNSNNNSNIIEGDNNGNVTLQNININFNVYGSEDYGIVDLMKLISVIKRYPDKVDVVLKVIELVNFNPRYPKNKNIYVSNKKTKDINLYGKNGWEIQPPSYSKDIIISILKFLKQIYEDLCDKLTNDQKASLMTLLNFTRVPEDDLLTDKKFKNFQKEVLCYLYNNRDIVMELLSK